MDGFSIDALPDKGLLELGDSKPPAIIKSEESKEVLEPPKRKKKPAWFDEDDKIIAEEGFRNAIKYPKKVTPSSKYRAHLVDKFESIYGQPKWAVAVSAKSDEKIDQLTTSGDILIEGKRLPKNNLNFTKCACLAKFSSIVSSVQFHPKENIALVAGVNGQIDIVHVDGDENKKLTSLLLDNFQLHQACLTIDGAEIIIGSKTISGYFYSYEMESGTHTRVPFLRGKDRLSLKNFTLSPDGNYLASIGRKDCFHLMSMKPKEIISSFQLNDEVHGLCFSPDSGKLFAGGNEGLIYVYDLRHTKRCFHRFFDDGAISCLTLSTSPNSAYFVIGDQSGLINAYRYEDVLSSRNPKPIRSFNNLKTSITAIKFNHTSELAIMASSYSDNAVRVTHFPSCSVFSNLLSPNLRRINAIDISPNSGYIAIANNLGYAALYRLNHFPDY